MKKHDLISRNLKYKGHRVKVYEDILESPDGQKLYYDYVENRNGSGILLVDNDGKLLFVKQYRNSINDFDIEIPAGCVETKDYSEIKINDDDQMKYDNEDFMKADNPFYICALREAEEETGYIPTKVSFVNYIIASVGLFSERTAIYIGEELSMGKLERDYDEYIDIIRLTPEEALEYIRSGIINDSKTIIAIQAYVMSH